MLLPFQVAFVFGVALRPFMVAALPLELYESINDSEEDIATTLAPRNYLSHQNSAEVGIGSSNIQQNSAEVSVGSVTIQPNSLEVGDGSSTIQQNSAEVSTVPTTANPGNSAEVTDAPVRGEISSTSNIQASQDSNASGGSSSSNTATGTQVTKGEIPSVGSQQEVVESNVNSETSQNNAGATSVAGTQPFYPKVTSVKEVQNTNTDKDAVAKPAVVKVSGIEPVLYIHDVKQAVAEPEDTNKSELLKIAGVEPISPEGNTDEGVPNSLRDALAQVGVENSVDDQLINEAKKYFISIWNLEAHRLNAPFMEVEDVWPEVGMVYMPTINQMSSKIQNSKPVKEAAERLKIVWDERKPNKDAEQDTGPILSALQDFLSNLGFLYDRNTEVLSKS